MNTQLQADNDFSDNLIKCVLQSSSIPNREYVCTLTKLGKGAYSKVYKGYIKSDNDDDEPKQYVAIKKMNLQQLRAHDFLENEIDIMKRLNHPNILNMIDVIEKKNVSNEKILYLILDICEGGDLKKLVGRHRRMKEKYAIVYFKQIAEGLKYLRSKNIIHRDLKPHNVLLMSDKKTLKIADFGFAKMIGNDTLAETMCGSPLYMAPEILLKKPYSNKADLWSVGVMLYEVLCATHPFKSVENIVDLVHKVERDEIQFPSSAKISPLGIDLLKRLLKKNPLHRIGWEEFFNHKWFQMVKNDTNSASFNRSGSTGSMSFFNLSTSSTSSTSSTLFTSLKPSHSQSIPPATSPLPIIDDYSSASINARMSAMSPPSFINSPMLPNEGSSSIRMNIIDNYESESTSSYGSRPTNGVHSMPMLPFESSEYDSNNPNDSKSSKKSGFGDYLGTSLKMLRDSFHSQSLH